MMSHAVVTLNNRMSVVKKMNHHQFWGTDSIAERSEFSPKRKEKNSLYSMTTCDITYHFVNNCSHQKTVMNCVAPSNIQPGSGPIRLWSTKECHTWIEVLGTQGYCRSKARLIQTAKKFYWLGI
jgi:hypothetical protein